MSEGRGRLLFKTANGARDAGPFGHTMAQLSPLAQVLAPLVPPLAYAARDNFAALHTLRGFEALVSSIAHKAREQGVAAELLEPLLASARGFDGADAATRKTALARLAFALGQHLSLPDALRAIARPDGHGTQLKLPTTPAANEARPIARAAPAPQPKPPPRREIAYADVDPPPRSAAAKKKAVAAAPAGSTEDKPKKKRAPRRKKITAYGANDSIASESEAEYGTRKSSFSGSLGTPLKEVTRVHATLAAVLKSKRLQTVGDALFFFPRGYEDRRRVLPISQLRAGERGVTVGTVKLAGEVPLGRRRVFRVVLGDQTGSIAATWYYYSPWIRKKYEVGQRIAVCGEVKAFGGVREMAHPETAPADDVAADTVNFGRIVPVYVGFEKGEQRSFRNLAHAVMTKHASGVVDPLPKNLLERIRMPALPDALREVHFPSHGDMGQLEAHRTPAQRRLAFDELFFIQLGMALRRKGVKLTPGIQFQVSEELVRKSESRLPFKLTNAQGRVVREIVKDMGKPEPMNRLIQGDVGSGKTAVALVSALVAIENGYQVALMAPTEILAEQHHRNLSRWLEPTGNKAVLLSAGMGKKEKEASKELAAKGEAALVVGTHAVLEDDVHFQKLGLVIIDEQHRFGVLQRAKLMAKGVRPDVLVMTATPIPRTLAMTLYGDLELSVIDELPPGRTPIFTRVFPERDRRKLYTLVGSELQKGRQAYVIYPLVEESEKIDLASATEGAEQLKQIFPDYTVGLLHGRMKGEEKDAVMAAFRSGEIKLLVSTTVVEVGVDVPNATIIVIESADRFGLSQLHQLRGRVGRGTEKSYCFLIGGGSKKEEAVQRLAVMERTTNGFDIAEEDLKIRGPGEVLGTRQSGVPGLSVADLARDQDLLVIAREEAARVADEDPRMERDEHRPLLRALQEHWEGKLELSQIG